MQNRTYGDLFNLVQSLAGVNAFTAEEQADVSRFINRRYYQAYLQSPSWVRYLVPSEERPVASIEFKNYQNDDGPKNTMFVKVGTSDTALNRDSGADVFVSNDQKTDSFCRVSGGWIFFSGSDYTINPITNVVTYTGDNGISYYLQKSTDTAIYSSPAEVKEWVHSGGGASSTNDPANIEVNGCAKILYDSPLFPIINTGKATGTLATIGDFIRIYQERALQRNSSIEYDFFVDADGANIVNSTLIGNSAFVTYKKPFVKFTTSSDYGTSTEIVPEEFFSFIAHTAYADFLRMDGQHQKAMTEEEIAKGALDLQLERNDIIANNNNATMRFSTYVNRQSR